MSKLILEVCRIINVKKSSTSSYHPQCDGFVERVNGVLMQTLSMFVASSQRDWCSHLAAVVFAYNTSVSSTTGETPFCLMYGREARLPHDTSLIPRQEATRNVDVHIERFLFQIRLARRHARENMQRAQVQMKAYYDQRAKDHPFKVGHKVWVYTPAVKKGLVKKLTSLWYGPFRLMERITPVTFKVSNMAGKELTSAVHVSRMKQCYDYMDIPTEKPEEI